MKGWVNYYGKCNYECNKLLFNIQNLPTPPSPHFTKVKRILKGSKYLIVDYFSCQVKLQQQMYLMIQYKI